MTITDAIKTLDDVIPPPDDPMVDLAHLQIAQAWATAKDYLQNYFLMAKLICEESEA